MIFWGTWGNREWVFGVHGGIGKRKGFPLNLDFGVHGGIENDFLGYFVTPKSNFGVHGGIQNQFLGYIRELRPPCYPLCPKACVAVELFALRIVRLWSSLALRIIRPRSNPIEVAEGYTCEPKRSKP